MKVLSAYCITCLLFVSVSAELANAQVRIVRPKRAAPKDAKRNDHSDHRHNQRNRGLVHYGGFHSIAPIYPLLPGYFYGQSPACIASPYDYYPPTFFPSLFPLVHDPFAMAIPMTPMVDPFAGFDPRIRNAGPPAMSGLPPVAAENFAHRGLGPAGAGRVAAVEAEPAVAIDPEPAFDGLNEIRRRVSVLKSSTPQNREHADRLISMGDAAFADQKLGRANALYRDAISKAPDYAAGHFRLAHSYIGSRQYTLAQKSLMIALELSGSVTRDGFSLEDIYQGDKFIRDKHLETLLDASKREPNDGGLRLLLGFFLHYDNKPLQAREHFEAANQISGLHRNYTRYFLPAKPIAEL